CVDQRFLARRGSLDELPAEPGRFSANFVCVPGFLLAPPRHGRRGLRAPSLGRRLCLLTGRRFLGGARGRSRRLTLERGTAHTPRGQFHLTRIFGVSFELVGQVAREVSAAEKE